MTPAILVQVLTWPDRVARIAISSAMMKRAREAADLTSRGASHNCSCDFRFKPAAQHLIMLQLLLRCSAAVRRLQGAAPDFAGEPP